jgi:hypothetical protein
MPREEKDPARHPDRFNRNFLGSLGGVAVASVLEGIGVSGPIDFLIGVAAWVGIYRALDPARKTS